MNIKLWGGGGGGNGYFQKIGGHGGYVEINITQMTDTNILVVVGGGGKGAQCPSGSGGAGGAGFSGIVLMNGNIMACAAGGGGASRSFQGCDVNSVCDQNTGSNQFAMPGVGYGAGGQGYVWYESGRNGVGYPNFTGGAMGDGGCVYPQGNGGFGGGAGGGVCSNGAACNEGAGGVGGGGGGGGNPGGYGGKHGIPGQAGTNYIFVNQNIVVVASRGNGTLGGTISSGFDGENGRVSIYCPVPPTVSGLYISDLSTTSITLNWQIDNDGGTPVSEFRIFYKFNNLQRTINLNATYNQIILENLQPGTLYTLQVSAVNDVGYGPYSDPLNVTTLSITIATSSTAQSNQNTVQSSDMQISATSINPPIQTSAVLSDDENSEPKSKCDSSCIGTWVGTVAGIVSLTVAIIAIVMKCRKKKDAARIP